jgi:hypothetical protein
MKKVSIYLLGFLIALPVFAQTIPQLDKWNLSGTLLTPRTSTWGIQVPSLGSSGTPCVVVNSQGLLSTSTCGISGITATTTLTGYTNGSVLFASSSVIGQNNARFFWDNVNERLVVGSSTSIGSRLEVQGTTTANSQIRASQVGTGANLGGGLIMHHSNDGGALPLLNDRLGYVLFGSRDGNNDRNGGGIVGYADGNWISGTSIPTRFVFEIAPAGSTVRSGIMTIKSTGADVTGNVAITGSLTSYGSNQNLQFNNSGVFGGANTSFWDSTYNGLSLGKNTSAISLLDAQPVVGKGVIAIDSSLGASPKSITVQGRYIYTADTGNDLLKIFKQSTETSLDLVGSFALTNPIKVVVAGDYAYVIHNTTDIKVLDISDPANIVAKSTFTTGNGSPIDLTVRGAYLYVLDTTGFIEVYNIQIPTAVLFLRDVSTFGTNMVAMWMTNNYIYIVDSVAQSLEIYTLLLQSNPTLVGSLTLSGEPKKIYVQESYAYIVETDKLEIVNVSAANAPVSVSNYTLDGNSSGNTIWVQGKYAYVGVGSSVLEVINILDPANPVQHDVQSSSGVFNDITVVGRLLYGINETPQLEVWDFGSAHIAQLEAGGIETGTLSVRNNIEADSMVLRGGLSVMGGLYSKNEPIISGSGTANFIPTFSSTYVITDSPIQLAGTYVGVKIAPTQVFHIFDDIPSTITRLYVQYGASNIITLKINASAGYVSTVNNLPLIFQTNNLDRGRFDTSGNFVVGSITAAAKLHVYGNSGVISSYVQSATDILALKISSGAAGYLSTITNIPLIFQTNDAERARLTTGGNFGIGTAAPTNVLSFGGESARTIWMERRTTAGTVGNNLTLQAGGSYTGGSNVYGGDLILQTGVGTGNSRAARVFIKAPLGSGSSGTTDQTLIDRVVFNNNKSLTSGTNVVLFQMGAATNNTMAGGQISYTIKVTDGTDFIVESGRVVYSVVNRAGTYTGNTSIIGTPATARSDGTDTITTTFNTNGNDFRINSSITGMTPTTFRITFNIENNADQVTTPP